MESSHRLPPPRRARKSALRRELHEKALRHAVWIGVFHSQCLGEVEICGQLTTILVAIDELRELHESQQSRALDRVHG